MKYVYSTLIIFFFSFLSQAQQGIDFIQLKTGEQLTGEIFQPTNAKKEVQFKRVGEANFTTYTTADIQGYQHHQNYYAACNIPEQGGSIFMQILVKGAANLYAVFQNDVFYIEKDGSFHLLERNDRIVNGKQMEDRRFAGILKALFKDCELPSGLFDKVRMSASSLMEITETYNTCRDPRAVYSKDKKKSGVVFGAGVAAGVNFNKIVPDEDDYTFLSETYGYQAGYAAALDVTMSGGFLGGFYLKPEVGLIKKQGGFSEKFSQDIEENRFDFGFVQLSFKAGYVLKGKKISPFISAGYLNSIPFQKEQTIVTTQISTNEVVSTEKITFKNSIETGFTADAGIEFNTPGKLRPFFMYEFEKSSVPFINSTGKFTTHKAMLGIRF